jgi:hypothetical protein
VLFGLVHRGKFSLIDVRLQVPSKLSDLKYGTNLYGTLSLAEAGIALFKPVSSYTVILSRIAIRIGGGAQPWLHPMGFALFSPADLLQARDVTGQQPNMQVCNPKNTRSPVNWRIVHALIHRGPIARGFAGERPMFWRLRRAFEPSSLAPYRLRGFANAREILGSHVRDRCKCGDLQREDYYIGVRRPSL